MWAKNIFILIVMFRLNKILDSPFTIMYIKVGTYKFNRDKFSLVW